ncbi:uncharacterized protein SOCE836_015680 [Sorangium cellulosum]|uniref:Transposase n=1 Tax=Sorangium cellulosum TaxID=56 RepID=A0A4P2QIM8_SORCE|nr:uncharacterized protein SOCE836_015680 [Sorangium cellulosum]
MRIVREAAACTQRGDIEALLRREGIYSSLLAAWRKQLALHGSEALAERKPGRPEPGATPTAVPQPPRPRPLGPQRRNAPLGAIHSWDSRPACLKPVGVLRSMIAVRGGAGASARAPKPKRDKRRRRDHPRMKSSTMSCAASSANCLAGDFMK